MQVVGLMGGVASGKSFVAQHLAQHGAGVLDADRAGHEVLRLAAVAAAVRARWGDQVFGPDGHIDRSRLARIVFADPPEGPRERKYLEQITHPEIGRLLARQASQWAAAGRPVAVLDAPLLVEAGWDKLCSTVIFVDAPREVRLARARERGWTEEEFDARQRAQESVEFKRQRADLIIDNSGPPETTAAQIDRIWSSLVP
jgi:dephospho-CoA kinase